MQFLKSKYGLVLTLFTLGLMAHIPAEAQKRKGREGSGGGSFLEMKFKQVAQSSVLWMSANQIRFAYGREIPLQRLHRIVYSDGLNIVISDEPISYEGSKKSAVAENSVITLYRQDWVQIQDDRAFRTMVLHELMRLVDVDDDDYKVSAALDKALIGMEASSAIDFSKLNKIVAKPGVTYFCEYDVAVVCLPLTKQHTWLNVTSVINPEGQKFYFGQCHGNLIYCP